MLLLFGVSLFVVDGLPAKVIGQASRMKKNNYGRKSIYAPHCTVGGIMLFLPKCAISGVLVPEW